MAFSEHPVPAEATHTHADVDLVGTVGKQVTRRAPMTEDDAVAWGFASRYAVVGRRANIDDITDQGVIREDLLRFCGPTVGGVARIRPLSAALAEIAGRHGLAEEPAVRPLDAAGLGASGRVQRRQ